jgi:hypothetical protein
VPEDEEINCLTKIVEVLTTKAHAAAELGGRSDSV